MKDKFLILLTFLFIISCKSNSIYVSSYDQIEIVNVSNNAKHLIDHNENIKLNSYLNALISSKHVFINKPDLIIYYYLKDKLVRTLSIFINENFIYDGDYLEAWYDRMNDRESNCFKMNDDFKNFLSKFNS